MEREGERSAIPKEIAQQIALKKLIDETREKCLKSLFDAQITRMHDRGVPESIVEIFREQRDSVIEKAFEMKIKKGNIPFLPVIPRTFRGPHDLMAMVRNGSRIGYTYLNPPNISNVSSVPEEPYYLYDIDTGESTRDKSPETADEIILEQKRHPLTIAEAIALATHTDVLSQHYIRALSSYYRGSEILCISLDNNSHPRLDENNHGVSGSPSCGER